MQKKITPRIEQVVREMKSEGYTNIDIMERTGLSRTAINDIIRGHHSVKKAYPRKKRQ